MFHKGPPLDTPQLAGGRKAEIRRRRIGLLFVRAIRAMSGIDHVTSGTGPDANVGHGSRRYSKTEMDVTPHMDVASQPVCDALSEPRRHTNKLQHEDQLRLDS